MGIAATRVVLAAGATGTLVVAAAQTKPQDAISNLAGWLHLLGIDDVPPILDTLAADRWASAFGAVLILVPLSWWLRKKRLEAAKLERRREISRLKAEISILEEQGADYKVIREARRRRMLQEASAPPWVPQPPAAGRAFMGTTSAALWGVDQPTSIVVINLKNFGQTPALDVKWRALAGYFESQPEDAEGGIEGAIGVTEPGHEHHIRLTLTRPIGTRDIQRFERGGAGLYVLAQIDYKDTNGEAHSRRMAYYADPLGMSEPGKWKLDLCPTGNEELW